MPEEPLTRKEYRRRQAQAAQAAPSTPAPRDLSREAHLQQTKQALEAERTTRLKHRLNWAIGGLSVAIVIVYLILFFVG
ncbi:hypothetical protein [Limosilactobacillus ingluviei]|uniref:hypothetical protein n=1 Tax=Limosilactobacillus ingluviei TaxID=148604 RepID=UPI0023F2BFB1|nr:hypothetical protein [Limosilactobacillus ingluviei]MDO4603548.1 hypothetical protein [Limosilactobacillus ingluviei]